MLSFGSMVLTPAKGVYKVMYDVFKDAEKQSHFYLYGDINYPTLVELATIPEIAIELVRKTDNNAIFRVKVPVKYCDIFVETYFNDNIKAIMNIVYLDVYDENGDYVGPKWLISVFNVELHKGFIRYCENEKDVSQYFTRFNMNDIDIND